MSGVNGLGIKEGDEILDADKLLMDYAQTQNEPAGYSFQKYVSHDGNNINVILYDENGNLVAQWDVNTQETKDFHYAVMQMFAQAQAQEIIQQGTTWGDTEEEKHDAMQWALQYSKKPRYLWERKYNLDRSKYITGPGSDDKQTRLRKDALRQLLGVR
jgi:hypothetical protein